VHVHIVPPSERGWQLVDATLVNGRRLQDNNRKISGTAQQQTQQQLPLQEQAVWFYSMLPTASVTAI
jgi:hypothetical protein